MSLPPQPPGRLETNMNPCPSRSGEGQKSLSVLLIGSPTLTGSPNGPSGLARSATQMSMPPNPPGRSEAMYSCSPLRDRIGQPSRYGVFSSELVPGTDSRFAAGPQDENEGAAKAVVVTSRIKKVARNVWNKRWFNIISIPPQENLKGINRQSRYVSPCSVAKEESVDCLPVYNICS